MRFEFPGMNLNHGDTADREVHRVPLVSLCHRGSNEMTKEGFNTSHATKEGANTSHVLSFRAERTETLCWYACRKRRREISEGASCGMLASLSVVHPKRFLISASYTMYKQVAGASLV